MQAPDFNHFLKNEFELRKSKNSRYSLRAFARDLDLEPSYLSKILRGERKLSLKSWQRLSIKLHAASSDDTHYIDHHIVAPNDLSRFSWFHLAILECFQLILPKITPSSIGKTLGLTEEEVTQALNELNEMGYLELVDGEFTISRDKNRIWSGNINARLMTEDFLRQSIAAIYNVDHKRRLSSALVVATNRNKIDEAKRRIIEFHQELIRYLEDTPEKNDIYVLTTGFNPFNLKNP